MSDGDSTHHRQGGVRRATKKAKSGQGIHPSVLEPKGTTTPLFLSQTYFTKPLNQKSKNQQTTQRLKPANIRPKSEAIDQASRPASKRKKEEPTRTQQMHKATTNKAMQQSEAAKRRNKQQKSTTNNYYQKENEANTRRQILSCPLGQVFNTSDG